jgi:hypothetical protein
MIVIPGRAKQESINPSVSFSAKSPPLGVWIPGLRQVAHPGMTKSKTQTLCLAS